MSLISPFQESLGKEWMLDHVSIRAQAESVDMFWVLGVHGSPRPSDGCKTAGREGTELEQKPKFSRTEKLHC